MTIGARNSKGLELPVLRLGLAGFTAAQEATIRNAIQTGPDALKWELSPLAEADAWFVEGSRLRGLPDGTVQIAPGSPSSRTIRIDPNDVEWPVVVCGFPKIPLVKDGQAFHTDSPENIRVLRTKLEGRLGPLIIQHYLASRIVEQNLDLRDAVFHVSVKERLFAVIGQRSGVGVWPIANPALLPQAQWVRRPLSADAIPHYFVRTEFAQMLWRYAMRTQRDLLPPHYRTSTLYLRRPPQLPLRLVDDGSLLLVHELSRTPGTFMDLVRRTGIGETQVARRLAGLYLVGSITATASRAAAGGDLSSAFEGGAGAARRGPEMTVRLKATRSAGFAQ